MSREQHLESAGNCLAFCKEKLFSDNDAKAALDELRHAVKYLLDIERERDKPKKWETVPPDALLSEAQLRGRVAALESELAESQADAKHYAKGVAHWLAKSKGEGRECGGCLGCGDDSLMNSNVCVGAGWIAPKATLEKVTGKLPASRLDELESELAAKGRELEKAENNYRFMVERAADQKLDGYRELGQRAAQAEQDRDRERSRREALEREVREIRRTAAEYETSGRDYAAVGNMQAALSEIDNRCQSVLEGSKYE